MFLTMKNLPSELILLIFELILKITDKRQFLRTCKKYNILTKQSMILYENNYPIPYFNKITEYSVAKFTLELNYDKYFDMIPEHYISPNNSTLISSSAYFGNILALNKIKLKNDFNYEYMMTLNINNNAANNGQLDVLKWANENGYLPTFNTPFCAVRGGHLPVIQYLHDNGYKFQDIFSEAAEYGHIPVLIWAKENYTDFDSISTCAAASRKGHLHVLQWAHENGFSWDERTCSMAAYKGHLSCLKYARANGCEWDKKVYLFAKKYGHIELLNWAIENGCPT